MFEDKMISEILETEKKKRRVSGIKFAYYVSERIKSVRELVKSGNDFSGYGRDKDNISIWLYENFPRLEQISKNDVKTVLHMGFLQGRDGFPLFFFVFTRVLCKCTEISAKNADCIFEKCNNYGKGLDLKNGRSLLYLFRLAVCVRLCECFEDAARDGGGERDILSEIENLFSTLDVLTGFSDERVVKNNPVEKVLLTDPADLYSNLTDETKVSYRRNLIRLAAKKKVSQQEYAEYIVNECSQNKGDERHIGLFLCDKPCGGKTYLVLLIFLTCLFTILLSLISPLFVVTVFSVYGSTKLLLDKIFNKFIIGSFCVPCVKLREIPDRHGVMVVITSLLDGSENDGELFDRLERMYYSNGGKNVCFAALCDLCDSREKENEKDREIICKANEMILKLRQKYGNCFFLFLRDREYSEYEEMYIAPERKRGAVNALASFLCSKSDSFREGSIRPDEEICGNIKYVLTLDADTNPEFDCLRKMVGIMIHPQNRPVCDKEKAVVVKGYGILQPRMVTTLSSSKKSVFTSVLCGHGGTNGYSNASADASMSLFGRGIFCGKGLFDKNCFYDVLCGDNAFLENSVLSHDAPEGARLRCANLADVTFTDSFPTEQLSYFKRQHRWIRGDIQNIPFLLPKVYTVDGRKLKNFISGASRFFMWSNVFSAINPIFTVLLIVVSAFCDERTEILVVTVAMSVYILPFIYSVFALPKRRIWHNLRRRFYSKGIYTGVWTVFLQMLLSVCFIVKEAQVSLDAVVRSMFRSFVSHRKMLEWTTAAQNDREKKDGILGYVKKNLLSAVLGAALFIVSDNGFVRLVSLMWFFAPVVAYYTGKERRRKSFVPSKKQKETVLSYCRDMWKFFSENVNESTSYLPTDNISLYPERKMSRMTSPTNIGLYLLSAVCSARLGFVDAPELDKRLYDTLLCVKKLSTCKGLLYNWYDVFTREPMKPMYVSSVDIGNYAACLITVNEGICEFKDKMQRYDEIKNLISELIDCCRVQELYDYERGLFYIGGIDENGEFIPDKNHYDMLMSEARILSFVSVALKLVPSEHYKKLSRTFVSGNGYMGLASWSGTVFEYFMPEIFFPSKSGSLVYEALCFCFELSEKGGVLTDNGIVFGISESCYNELDDAANYKYRAFGIPEIALDVIRKQKVVSPYSSFLCMNFAPRKVLANLENIAKTGAYGEYGFYESIDFERHVRNEAFGIVKCFMSHHVGMSIAACTNFLCDGRVSEWFSENKKTGSALEISGEAIPYDAYVKKIPRKHYKYANNLRTVKDKRVSSPSLRASLSDGKMYVGAKKGRLEIRCTEYLVSRKNCFPESLGAFLFYAEIDGERFLFDSKSFLFQGAGRIKYSKKIRKTTGEYFDISLEFTLVRNTSDTLRIAVSLKRLSGKSNQRIVFGVEFYPVLDVKKNNRHCFFFDSRDVANEVCEEKEVYFRRFSNNICFCAGGVKGRNCRAAIENEKIVLTAVPYEENGKISAEFAISFSESKVCAQMGLVRCTEEKFDEACVSLEKRNELKRIKESGRKRNERAKGVLGCSMVKEERHVHLPVGGEKGHLMCTERLCCLVYENDLGVSFVKDINSGRITSFQGINSRNNTGESIINENDGFDFCKQASKCEFLPHVANYYGTYKDREYKVSVVVHPVLPCKIICVDCMCDDGICFEVIPEEAVCRHRYIGSGLAFFGGGEHDAEKGFAFGYRIFDKADTCGAEYKFDDGIKVCFREREKRENIGVRYAFGIGFASEERAFEVLQSLQKTVFEKTVCECEEFCRSIRFLPERMPDIVKETLEMYFVFPKNNTVSRAFVKTSPEICLFDTLLLLYSDSTISSAKLETAAKLNPLDTLPRLVMCLVVSEHFRMTSDASYLEKSVGDDTLYRRCLSYLFNCGNTDCFRPLYLLCLERFSEVCYGIGDIRTCQALKESKRKAENGENGAILL